MRYMPLGHEHAEQALWLNAFKLGRECQKPNMAEGGLLAVPLQEYSKTDAFTIQCPKARYQMHSSETNPHTGAVDARKQLRPEPC